MFCSLKLIMHEFPSFPYCSLPHCSRAAAENFLEASPTVLYFSICGTSPWSSAVLLTQFTSIQFSCLFLYNAVISRHFYRERSQHEQEEEKGQKLPFHREKPADPDSEVKNFCCFGWSLEDRRREKDMTDTDCWTGFLF